MLLHVLYCFYMQRNTCIVYGYIYVYINVYMGMYKYILPFFLYIQALIVTSTTLTQGRGRMGITF